MNKHLKKISEKAKKIRNNQELSWLMINSLACLLFGLLTLQIDAYSIVAVGAGTYGLIRSFKGAQ